MRHLDRKLVRAVLLPANLILVALVVFAVLASTVEGDLRRAPGGPDADLPQPGGGPVAIPSFRVRLTVKVTSVRNDKGKVLVWAYDKGPLTERGNVVAAAVIAAATQGVEVSLELPRGSYAIMAVHDENDDGKLEVPPGGPPAEGMGLTGSQGPLQGPPDFERARIELERDVMEIELPVVYH
jgi:uncharacterized protein (DUF2141 family)